MCVLPANAKDEKKIAWESIRGEGTSCKFM